MGIRKPSEYFDREKASVENSMRESSKNPELNTVSDAYNTFKSNLSKVDLLTDFSETLENYQLNIEKVNHLSTKIDEIDEDIKTLLTKEDLDKALISQLLFLEECIHDVQEKVKNINHKNLAQVKSDVSSLSETVNFFIDEEIPKYKKYVFESEFRLTNKYEALSEEVEETLSNAKEFVDEKYNQDFNNINEKINIINQKINNIKTDDILTYKNLIAGSEIKTESKIKEFAESLNNTVNDVVSKIELVKEDNTEIFDTLNSKVNQVNQIHNLIIEDIEKNETTRDELDKKIVDLKVEILRNESHIKNQNKNIENIHEDVKSAINKLNIDEIEQNNFKLARKIKYFEEVFEKFNEKEILNENIITEPSSTNNDDPLTPLDNNFVTLDQLQNHYRLFINRIQQQLATIGGGGETRLEFLDDIDRDTAKSNGKFLKYDESLDKWVGGDAGGQANTFKVEDLTDNRVVIVGTGGELEDDANLTFNGSTLAVGVNLDVTGDLDVDGHTELDNLNVSGLSTFVGALDASGGVVGNVTGTASNATLAVNAQGLTGTPNITVGSVTAASGSFSGNVTIGGTLTYQDVEHIDSVGIITAQQGIQVLSNGLTITGVSTFQGNVNLGDDDRLKFGDGGDLQIYHNGLNSVIKDSGTGDLFFVSNTYRFRNALDNEQIANFFENSSVELFYDNIKKFETTSDGIVVTGINTADAFAGFDYLKAPHGTTVNYAVTVAAKTAAHRYNGSGSSNGYLIDGVESPFLTFTPGRTYRFTLSSSDMSSHPFRFYLEADKTTAYTTNVTSTATYTEILVTDTTPTVLHYQCSSHGYMGNAVQVNSNKVNTPYQIDGLKGANITGIATATSFSGSGSNLTGLTGASAATYGSAGATPVIVVDSNGRITGISTVATSGGGGSVSEAFKTISVSGQSDVVADDATDTLTLVAGSNMTITTNASGDSITFASSGGGGGGSSGVEIKNNGTSVGTGITAIDFSTNVTATASSGVATVTASGGGGGGVTTGKAIAMAIVFG